jgi:hypothetical protein
MLGDNVLWSDTVKALLCKSHAENVAVDVNSLLALVNLPCVCLERFPTDEVQEWSAFDCTAIAECDFTYGIE